MQISTVSLALSLSSLDYTTTRGLITMLSTDLTVSGAVIVPPCNVMQCNARSAPGARQLMQFIAESRLETERKVHEKQPRSNFDGGDYGD